MDNYLLHPLGKVTLVDNELVSHIDPKRGMLGHKQGEESRLSVSAVHAIYVIDSSGSDADVVFATTDSFIGFRNCKQSLVRVDGQSHQLIEEFAQALLAISPSIEVNHPVSSAKLGDIKWAEPGAKVGFFKSARMDARAALDAKQARESTGPQVQVKRYKNAKDYEKDARTMLRAGWRMEGQSSGRGRVNMGRTVLKAGVLLPWAVMRPSRKGDPITVTWLKGGQLEEADHPDAVGESSLAEPREDVTETLRKLAELRAAGILTDEEFDAKKTDLLARI